jgi:hypothetical protein
MARFGEVKLPAAVVISTTSSTASCNVVRPMAIAVLLPMKMQALAAEKDDT